MRDVVSLLALLPSLWVGASNQVVMRKKPIPAP